MRVPSELGLREQNKLDKRQRIRAAARELFSKHGYDSATLRQIARRAHVGLGTLFNYAQDKRDLVFLIFNEELAAVTDEALGPWSRTTPCSINSSTFTNRITNTQQAPRALAHPPEGADILLGGKTGSGIPGNWRTPDLGIEKAIRTAQEERRIRSTKTRRSSRGNSSYLIGRDSLVDCRSEPTPTGGTG